jgi:hypothetical protein
MAGVRFPPIADISLVSAFDPFLPLAAGRNFDYQRAMFAPKLTIDLRQASAARFLDCAADYLDASGFMDLDREPARIRAKKKWPASSTWGTAATLAPFNWAVVHADDGWATIELGPAQSFVVTSIVMFALCMAGLWWLPPTTRALIGVGVAGLAYVAGTFFALARARLAFSGLARRCARQS